MKILFTIASALLSISSWAQSAGAEKPDSSFIYIYRVGQFTGSLANWTISVDDQKLCKLSNDGYIRVFVKPGKHNISATRSGVGVLKKETEVDIDAEKGNNYYVACNVKQSVVRSRLEMIEVTKATGIRQMEKLSPDNCQSSSQ